ncbi:MAG: hypothetical protein ACYDBW_07415 [Sulfuricaulis sp.]
MDENSAARTMPTASAFEHREYSTGSAAIGRHTVLDPICQHYSWRAPSTKEGLNNSM